MNQTVTVRGRYVDKTFIPDGPLPVVEGEAELVITPSVTPTNPKRGSIADAFGKATTLKSAEELAARIREERDSWGER